MITLVDSVNLVHMYLILHGIVALVMSIFQKSTGFLFNNISYYYLKFPDIKKKHTCLTSNASVLFKIEPNDKTSIFMISIHYNLLYACYVVFPKVRL